MTRHPLEMSSADPAGDQAQAELDSWTKVLPCKITHEQPYDFRWCETHDRTFPLDGDCDHRGLSEIDYLTEMASSQRARAVFAEERAEIAEAQVRDLSSAQARTREHGTITVPRPHVPFGPDGVPAGQADAHYLHEAAQKLEEHYRPFGSNLRATVVQLIRDAADAVEATTEGTGNDEEGRA